MESGMQGFVSPTPVAETTPELRAMMKKGLEDIQRIKEELEAAVADEYSANYERLKVYVEVDRISIYGDEKIRDAHHVRHRLNLREGD